jgi:hypothetical protein
VSRKPFDEGREPTVARPLKRSWIGPSHDEKRRMEVNDKRPPAADAEDEPFGHPVGRLDDVSLYSET